MTEAPFASAAAASGRDASGRLRRVRRPRPAVSLTGDTAILVLLPGNARGLQVLRLRLQPRIWFLRRAHQRAGVTPSPTPPRASCALTHVQGQPFQPLQTPPGSPPAPECNVWAPRSRTDPGRAPSAHLPGLRIRVVERALECAWTACRPRDLGLEERALEQADAVLAGDRPADASVCRRIASRLARALWPPTARQDDRRCMLPCRRGRRRDQDAVRLADASSPRASRDAPDRHPTLEQLCRDARRVVAEPRAWRHPDLVASAASASSSRRLARRPLAAISRRPSSPPRGWPEEHARLVSISSAAGPRRRAPLRSSLE